MRKDKPSKLYSLRMTYQEHEQLVALADKKGVTKAGLVRELITRESKRVSRK